MIPVLFKKNEQQFRTYGLGEITDIINPKVTRERNGQYLFYFQYPQNAEFSDVFEEEMRIKADAGVRTKWQTFEISRVIRKEGELIEVFAKHISQSLLKDALNPSVNVRSSSAQQALRIWNNNRIGDEEFDVWSDITTTSSTNWDIRDVSNAFEALAGVQGSILDVWGGEYEFDNKMIRLHREMGRKAPVPLEYGRNITNVEQDIQDDNVYTSVYPFAVYTPEDADEPKTVTISERYVDGKYLDMHNKRKIQVVDFSGEFEYDDVPTGSQLRTLTNQYLESNEVGLPHENLKVEYIDLSRTLDYQEFQVMEEVELNDRLPIFYPKFGVTNENAKVVVVDYDPVKEENISIELGVIGQSFRTITTGGIGSRLDRIEKQQVETMGYIVNAQGNRIWFETPDENMEHKVGDTWFEKNGPYDRIRVWNGNQWETIIDSEDIDKNAKAIEEQQKDLEETKENIDNRLTDLNDDIADKFTDLDVEILAIETISNRANDNAQIAIDDAYTAYNTARTSIDIGNAAQLTAQSALDGIDGLETYVDVEIDNINGELSRKVSQTDFNSLDGTVSEISTVAYQNQYDIGLKADSSLVDTINQTVENHSLAINANAEALDLKADSEVVDTLNNRVSTAETNININAEGLVLKADQTEVDTLTGTVSSLGAEFDIVAGQVSNRVWKTDIEGAIADIEVGGRNLIIESGVTPRIWLNSDGTTKNYSQAFTTDYIDVQEGEDYTVTQIEVGHSNLWRAGLYDEYYNFIGVYTEDRRQEVVNTFTIPAEVSKIRLSGRSLSGEYEEPYKLEKGNIATDWTPAPEDTDARIEYIETNWVQTFESFEQVVSSIDGRVTSQDQRIDSVTTTIQEVQSDIDGNTKLINQTKSTVDTHTQTIATIETDLDGKATVAQYNTLVSTVEGTIQRIGNAEGDITQIEANISGLQTTVAGKASQTDVTQLSNLYSVVVSDLTDLETDTEAQFSVMLEQINLRVTKGDVLSQINLEAGRTLIQSDKLLLDAQTTVFTGSAFIPGAYIENASIDNAKIADATISSAKIAKLDVNKLSGNRTEFVESYWNSAVGGNVRITGNGILTTASDSSQTYIQDGIVGTRNPSGATIGQIGYFYNNNSPWYTMQVSNGSHFQINMSRGEGRLNKRAFYIMAGGVESYLNTDYIYLNAAQRTTVQSAMSVQGNLGMGGNDVNNAYGYYLNYGGGMYALSSNSELRIDSSGGLRFITSGGTAFNADNTYVYMQRNMSMEGNRITNQSDERLKMNIENTHLNSLEAIKSWIFVNYDWIEGEHNQFGLIAQYTSEISIYEKERDIWSIDSSRQLMMTTHAVQQLSLAHDNTNLVASEALIKAESNEEKIERLEKRIEELESAA